MGRMAKQAWRWKEPPAISPLRQSVFAASPVSCLLMSVCTVGYLPLAIFAGEPAAGWARALAIGGIAVSAALMTFMYLAFTSRRPRALIPPVLRKTTEDSGRQSPGS